MRKFWRALQQFFLSEHGQLAFAVVLLILIPVALVINTYSSIQSAQRNMDVELQRKALLAERIFQSSGQDLLTDDTKLQQLVTRVGESSEEVWGLDVLKPAGENYVVVASLVPTAIGQTATDLNLTIAWHENEAIAYQTSSSDRTTVGRPSQNASRDQRFWVVVSPLTNEAGAKVALVSMKFSSQVVDDLVQASVTRATGILIMTIAIIVLLLAVNSKLFQYTVLFRKLKEVDQMKDEFISIASHELRTPITGIRGYLEMILDGSLGALPEQMKQPLLIVDQSAQRLGALVEDLLNVSRLEQGRLDLELSDVDPLTVINEVIAELMPMAKPKDLKLAYHGPDTLLHLKLNRDRFKQVMINLVGNGIKYSLKGSVTVEAELKDKTARIKVADTGIGMSPKDMERLFTKFYRVQNDETKHVAGSGLGLWITKAIVEKMNGTIEVESIEGVGSQFIVNFPIPSDRKVKTS